MYLKTFRCATTFVKALGRGGVYSSTEGGGALEVFEKFRGVPITSLLITRFFFPTPEMKARDQAVQKRHRNQESAKWLPR